MRFSMHDFVLKGLIAAIGVQSDYWVILEAARWFEKGILLEEDLVEIQRLIDEKNTPQPEPEPVEESVAETETETQSDTQDEDAPEEDKYNLNEEEKEVEK